jgi:hypothetical protein
MSSRPKLTAAISWEIYERFVLDVFSRSLIKLSENTELPKQETPINLALYRVCLEVHYNLLQANKSIPFVIFTEANNQPLHDDTISSSRLKKRPDFICALNDYLATDANKAQVQYPLECKRLGLSDSQWPLNENYYKNGISRFVKAEYGYAKKCPSATMIGYVQSMDFESVTNEVNKFVGENKLPSLSKAVSEWSGNNLAFLSQQSMKREAPEDDIKLNHLWIDVRKCYPALPPTTPTQDAKKHRQPKKKLK